MNMITNCAVQISPIERYEIVVAIVIAETSKCNTHQPVPESHLGHESGRLGSSIARLESDRGIAGLCNREVYCAKRMNLKQDRSEKSRKVRKKKERVSPPGAP